MWHSTRLFHTSLFATFLFFLANTAVAQQEPDPDDPVSQAPPKLPPIIGGGGGGGGGAGGGIPAGGGGAVVSPSRFISLSTLQAAPVTPEERESVSAKARVFAKEDDGFIGPAWSSISVTSSRLDDTDLDMIAATIGADIWASEVAIFGLMAQGDVSNQTGLDNLEFDSTGYLIGAYGIYQLSDYTFDARLLTGRAKTEVSDGTNSVDDVESTRWLANVQVTTQYDLGDGTILVPRLAVGYLQDDTDSYTLDGNFFEEERVAYGQTDIGASFLSPFTLENIGGNFVGGLTAIKAFGEGAETQVPTDVRGRVDFGVEFFNGDQWSISGKVFGDGIGVDEFESFGADLGVLIWF